MYCFDQLIVVAVVPKKIEIFGADCLCVCSSSVFVCSAFLVLLTLCLFIWLGFDV